MAGWHLVFKVTSREALEERHEDARSRPPCHPARADRLCDRTPDGLTETALCPLPLAHGFRDGLNSCLPARLSSPLSALPLPGVHTNTDKGPSRQPVFALESSGPRPGVGGQGGLAETQGPRRARRPQAHSQTCRDARPED